jgi:peptide/nickel transport system permease protein
MSDDHSRPEPEGGARSEGTPEEPEARPDEHHHHTPLDLRRRKSDAGPLSLRKARAAAAPIVAPYVTAARIAYSKLAHDRSAQAGAAVIAVLALVALSADLVGREGAVDRALLPPLAKGHLFGTDAFGRDLFARVVHGTRLSLTLGLGGAFILVAIGVALGALSGYLGGVVDGIVARAVEALMVIPTLLLVIVVQALLPHPTTTTLVLTIALTRWPELARLVRAEILRVLGRDYVAAARALGASPLRILWRHIMPNAVGPAIVAAAFGVASIVIIQASVGFLRVPTADTLASWGESLGEARSHPGAWWLVVFPGAALLATVVAFNLVGDAARDALDPWSPRTILAPGSPGSPPAPASPGPPRGSGLPPTPQRTRETA